MRFRVIVFWIHRQGIEDLLDRFRTELRDTLSTIPYSFVETGATKLASAVTSFEVGLEISGVNHFNPHRYHCRDTCTPYRFPDKACPPLIGFRRAPLRD